MRVRGVPGSTVMHRRAWLAWSSVGLISGCATRPPRTVTESISGRMVVQVAARGAVEARQMSTTFELRGHAQAGELDLLSPLGTMVAQARWRPEGAEVATTEGVRRFNNLSELARQVLGEPIPLEALADWLRARPWGGLPHTDTDEGFEQAGWKIDLQRAGEGFISAQRLWPEPKVSVRARLDAPAKPRGAAP